jgi:hypothetical protein
MNPRAFFVIHTDGTKFGPADIATLKVWIAENRVGPQTMLEDALTNEQIPASQVPELGLPVAPAAPTYGGGPAYGGAPTASAPWQTGQHNPVYVPDTSGNPNLWWWSLLCGLGACVVGYFIGIGGIFLGITALQQGWGSWKQGDKYKALPGILLGSIALIWRIYSFSQR